MIALASYIIAETWAYKHREDTAEPLEGVVAIMLLIAFAWFDLRMATILSGAI